MTAKKNPTAPESQKIWGYFTSDGEIYDDLTYKQACDKAVDHKKEWPNEDVTIFRNIAVVENQPALKMV